MFGPCGHYNEDRRPRNFEILSFPFDHPFHDVRLPQLVQAPKVDAAYVLDDSLDRADDLKLLTRILLLDPLDLFERTAGAEPMWRDVARDHEQFFIAEDFRPALLTAAQEHHRAGDCLAVGAPADQGCGVAVQALVHVRERDLSCLAG